MEDNNKPRKWRLNVFDVIIICAALLAGFLIYNLSDTGSVITMSGTQETIRYTVELGGMLVNAANAVKPGDQLTDKVQRRALGTVLSVEVTPHLIPGVNAATGEQFMTENVEERKAVTIVVEATADVTETEISVNGFAVRVGTDVSVLGPLYTGSGYIIDIERGDD